MKYRNTFISFFLVSANTYSGRHEDQYNVPGKIIKLFKGGKFDKNYNKKYHTHRITIPSETLEVKPPWAVLITLAMVLFQMNMAPGCMVGTAGVVEWM